MILHAKRVRGVCLSMLASTIILAASGIAPARAETEMQVVIDKAMTDFWIGDFVSLEKQYIVFRDSRDYTAEGYTKLNMFRDGVNKVLSHNAKPKEPYLQELEALTLQWAQEYPQSALAHILHLQVLVKHAWSYRGNGFAQDVSPQASKEFNRYLSKALDYMKAHGDIVLSDSSGHLALLNIGQGLGFDQKQMEVIAQEGLKRNPMDYELHFSIITSLLPKWGGDSKVLDTYIRKVAAQMRDQPGTGMYARLYSNAATNQYGYALFESSYADWPMMKQDFEDILKKYPGNASRRNRYAYFACMAKDKQTLQAQFEQIGSRLEVGEWGENGERNLEGCQRWVKET